MLTDKQIRAMQAREKQFVVSDGRSARGEGVLLLKIQPRAIATARCFPVGVGARTQPAKLPAKQGSVRTAEQSGGQHSGAGGLGKAG